ncbi:MAG: c-type cytochrome [Burkholderiales bacterium]|nr:c-type cytochrome [Burkholderiales bacterium]
MKKYLPLFAAWAVLHLFWGNALAAGNADRGGDVFDSQCAECHSVKAGKNKKGPSLFASIGRKAGTVPDFVYSDAMKQSGITWSPDKIEAYIAAPKTVVPGGKMKFDGKLTTQESADLLAFLTTLH